MNKYKELLFLKELNGVGPVRISKFYLPLLKDGTSIEKLKKIALENEKKVDPVGLEEAFQRALSIYNEVIGRKDIEIVTILDDNYPSKLKSLENKAPVILYVKGDISSTEKKSISIIGTRAPSEWSIKVERQLVGKILELSNRVIVSGLAIGCDRIAHKTCVENSGITIAMLPCGFDHITPTENVGLSQEIIKSGGVLITEYPPNTEATQYTFVERDTLIAAISDAVFVVECGKKSGTMHAVNAAFEMGRKVAAFKTENNNRGNFEGNEFIIFEKDGFAVPDNKSLKEFLDLIGEVETDDTPVQISLFDFMGE